MNDKELDAEPQPTSIPRNRIFAWTPNGMQIVDYGAEGWVTADFHNRIVAAISTVNRGLQAQLREYISGGTTFEKGEVPDPANATIPQMMPPPNTHEREPKRYAVRPSELQMDATDAHPVDFIVILASDFDTERAARLEAQQRQETASHNANFYANKCVELEQELTVADAARVKAERRVGELGDLVVQATGNLNWADTDVILVKLAAILHSGEGEK